MKALYTLSTAIFALIAVGCSSDPSSAQQTTVNSLEATANPASTQQMEGSALDSSKGQVFGAAGELSASGVAGLTKDIDEARAARFNALSARLGPEQEDLRNAVKNADWNGVLEQADRLEALWAASGEFKVEYKVERAEAYIGLGQPEQAILLLDPDPKHRDTPSNLAHALALALMGDLDAGSAVALVESAMRYIPGESPRSVNAPRTRNETIALVRMVRSIDASSSGQDTVAERESREALRLNPSLPIAALVLAEVLNRQDRYQEALPYWQQASLLSGSAGERAKEMAKSTQHVIAERGGKTQANAAGN